MIQAEERASKQKSLSSPVVANTNSTTNLMSVNAKTAMTTAATQSSSHNNATSNGGVSSAYNNATTTTIAVPRCVCGWKNCRTYQKAFADVKHPVLDGVVKIKFIKNDRESLELKNSIDRNLKVTTIKQNDWKTITVTNNATSTPIEQQVCKYTLARHHFTEKHILKYLQDPKNYSFTKPFSIHGAKKYLFLFDPTESFRNDNNSNSNLENGELLYLQTPNVTKEHVKTLYVMLKSNTQQQQVTKGTNNKDDHTGMSNNTNKELIDESHHHNSSNTSKANTTATTAAMSTTSNHSGSQQQRHHVQYNSNTNNNNNNNVGNVSAQLLALKEEENRRLKEQLDSMQSQLSFLHDMVRKLQEEHFDHHSVHTGRSSKYTANKSQNNKGNKNGSRNQNSGQSVSGNNSKKNNNNSNNNSNSNMNNNLNARFYSSYRSVGVPDEIELGIGDDNDETGHIRNKSANDGQGEAGNRSNTRRGQVDVDDDDDEDWSAYDDDDINDDDDIIDDETAGTFHRHHSQVLHRRPSLESNASRISKATTIVSASKSVKSLPREREIDDNDDDDSSLEEEAFENRSLASSRHSRDFDLHRTASRSRRAGRRTSIGSHGGQSLASRASRVSRNRSNNTKNSSKNSQQHQSPQQQQQSVTSDGSVNNTSATAAATYNVNELVVTDPYGEKGTYTGSISTSTGMPHGYGRLEYDRAGRWYEGDWKHGRWTGQGKLSNGDGDYYEGGLKNDHKHGRGIMKFADGRTFEGEYINGQMIEGKMTYQDGSTYAGSWVNGMRHGRGKCIFTDQSIYEGEFKEGEFFGHGKMSWSDGGWYEGEWWNGEMHGRGKEVRPDGSLRHDGEWNKGQPIRK